MNELLGGRIKTLRCAENLTQEQVAEQIGISRENMLVLKAVLIISRWMFCQR